uniref:Uncharacterized protein n=1 Tax=Tanacetum cinerariifolium TaxID=118510 RepID=A0A6L2MAR9_TANCI|nr:hypothetical protein [Tanacetum cinerariifolium]
MKVEESLNVTLDESPPLTKLSPLVDDDVGEEDAIIKNTKIVNTNNEEDELIEVEEIINIKEIQKLISQLEILGESLSQEDINLKFLRSLPSEWRTHTLIWKNKADLEDQSLDDLFNKLKIYEAEVKSSSSTSHTTQNIAFVSSNNTDSTNESVSVVPGVSAASTKASVSPLPNVDNLSDAVIYSFFASQSNSPQLDNEDLKQIDTDDLKEMDLKWSPRDTRNKDTQRRTVLVETSTSSALVLQCDGVGSYDWSFQDDEEPTNYALMTFTSSSSSSSDNEVATCSKACSKAYATLQSHYDNLTVNFKKSQFDVLLYKSGLESVEARLVIYQQNENVFEEDIKLLKLDVMLRDNALVELGKKLEKTKKERDELKQTIEKFQTSLKKSNSGSDDSVPTSPVHDRYKSSEGYHVVPPPYTGTFMPPKPDLVFHDASTVSKIVPNVFNVSDSEDESKGKPMPTQKEPSYVQTSEHVKTPRTSVKPVDLPTQAKNLRKDIPKSRGHKHHWNRKACFVCKSLTHLIKDCDNYENQMVQKPGNPQQALKDKGVIDNGFSRHMTGNMSYLSDFEEINRGYVAFESKRCVSQKCDKKNNVIFTDTECVVLSSDFKLPDENHVLLGFQERTTCIC